MKPKPHIRLHCVFYNTSIGTKWYVSYADGRFLTTEYNLPENAIQAAKDVLQSRWLRR